MTELYGDLESEIILGIGVLLNFFSEKSTYLPEYQLITALNVPIGIERAIHIMCNT